MPVQDLRSAAFPVLGDEQVTALARCAGATLRRYPDGHVLFKAGDRHFKFFVVRSGSIEILDEWEDTPKRVTVHQKGEFTGDVSHLFGKRALVSAVARGDTEVYEISTDAFREAQKLENKVGIALEVLSLAPAPLCKAEPPTVDVGAGSGDEPPLPPEEGSGSDGPVTKP